MKNSLRCCISCILPCGALDVIRIVHANGRVEEISGSVKAEDIMRAYPKHVLKKPSTSSDEGMCPKIVVVPPDAELQRGKIYFLMPLPATTTTSGKSSSSRSKTSSSTTRRKKKESHNSTTSSTNNNSTSNNNNNNNNSLMISDRYLSDILSEKTSATQRDRRRGRSAVWRPHLESISETPIEA